MGATNSKKKGHKKGSKDDTKSKGKKEYGGRGTPDALRNEICDLAEEYKTDKDAIKPLHYEKVGLTNMLNDERERLLGLLAVLEQLKLEREPLMTKCWEVDAEEIRRAFTKSMSSDKTLLVSVMACRTKWQLGEISKIYEQKYGMTLLTQIVNHLTTFLGSMFSGKVTELCNLLTYRLLPCHERDAGNCHLPPSILSLYYSMTSRYHTISLPSSSHTTHSTLQQSSRCATLPYPTASS